VAQTAVPIDLGVPWATGGPRPVVVSDAYRTFLAVPLAIPEDDGSTTAVIEWLHCSAFKFGFPGDEAQHGHPLWAGSPGPPPYYDAVEVKDSAWIAELEQIEGVAFPDKPIPFDDARHFVLLFQGSVFECVARDFRVIRSAQDPQKAALLAFASR
jgi:hypothetical protein